LAFAASETLTKLILYQILLLLQQETETRTSKMAETAAHTWQCLCGKFQAQATGKPLMAATCYCKMCRTFGGGPFALGVWDNKKITVTKGGQKDDLIKYLADEGKNYRYSCKTCGGMCYATRG
jgi:hypothetical protein